jgi:hypothetical protein
MRAAHTFALWASLACCGEMQAQSARERGVVASGEIPLLWPVVLVPETGLDLIASI